MMTLISLKSGSNLDFVGVFFSVYFTEQEAAGYSLLVYITNWMLGTFDPGSDFNCCGFLIVFSCHSVIDCVVRLMSIFLERQRRCRTEKKQKKKEEGLVTLMQPWTQSVMIYF